MKILIYGEFSGFGKSLAVGFRQLGFHSDVFSPNGDGFKEIESSLQLRSKGMIGKVFELIALIPLLGSYDKVLIMNPSFFSLFKGIGILPLLYFVLKKKDLFLVCCGDDVEYIRSGENGFVKKYVYSGAEYPKKKYFTRKLDLIVNYLCGRYSKWIVPAMYDYEVAWKNSRFRNKVTKVIPLACMVEPKPVIRKTNFEDVRILHGINRPNVKGTAVILEALKRIEREYRNVTVHTPERLSQKEYLSLFGAVDISIDQCKCHGYGMNAIYSMMHGHVVFAPADAHFNCSLGIEENPLVSISYDEDDIYRKLKQVLDQGGIDNLKSQTQDFAYNIHLSTKVASQFIDVIS